MIYILFGFLAILSTFAMVYICSRYGVVNFGKFNLYKLHDEECSPYVGKKLLLLILTCFATAFAVQVSLYTNTSVINFIKLFVLFLIVIDAAIIDSKRRIIPNAFIILGFCFRVLMYVFEMLFVKDEFKSILINDLIGFVIGFVFLAIVSLLTKGSLGFGDAKLFGVIGLTAGSFATYSTLLLSLIISVIVSVVNILRKKMGRKDSFPFGPCIAAGYIISVLLTSY